MTEPLPDGLGEALARLFNLPRPPESVPDLVELAAGAPASFGLTDLLTDTSRHEVAIGGERVYTHCALDALMLPTLTGRPVRIRSASPLGGVVSVVADTASATAQPEDAVLSIGVRRGADGPVQVVCCPLINLFTSRDEYARWARAETDAISVPLSLADGFRLAQALVAAPRSADDDGAARGETD